MSSPATERSNKNSLSKALREIFMRPNAQQPAEAGDEERPAPLEHDASKSRHELNRVNDERQHLRTVHREEVNRKAELEALLEIIEAQRVDALARHRMTGDAKDGELAHQLLTRTKAIRQDIVDSAAVAERIQAKVREIEAEREHRLQIYRTDFGALLDLQMANAADEYRKRAEEAAEAIILIAAIQKLMIRYGAGNSNGFWGQAHLPQIVAGDGRAHPAILDAGNRQFAESVGRRMDEMLDRLRELGYSAPDR